MSDERAEPAAAPAAPTTAGGLLRQARQAQGMHIAVLAANIKVSQRKLEALEADRVDELPDATFTRALAQTVCRSLKIDPAPVLALLPRPPSHRLEQVGEGINTPFRDRPGHESASEGSMLGSPAVWAPIVVLLLAAVVYFMPAGLVSLPGSLGASAPAPAASVTESVSPPPAAVPASVPASTAAVAAEVVAAAPAAGPVTTEAAAPAATDAPASAAAATAPAASGVLLLRTSAESWIEVIDGRGQALLQRALQPGEAVGLDGVMPLKLTIGNASATQVMFRGRSVELAPLTRRDNVARFDLK